MLSDSEHLWNCLPIELVRKVSREYDGAQISLGDVIAAATAMTGEKSLDAGVLGNFLRYKGCQSPGKMGTSGTGSLAPGSAWG